MNHAVLVQILRFVFVLPPLVLGIPQYSRVTEGAQGAPIKETETHVAEDLGFLSIYINEIR